MYIFIIFFHIYYQPVFLYFIIAIFESFILGAIIGGIIGKIKYKKK